MSPGNDGLLLKISYHISSTLTKHFMYQNTM